jgi:predicted transcriptional regulator
MSEHGGKRKGAGRKASRGEAKVTTSIGVTPEVKRYLDQCEESQSEVVEDAIRRSKAFREWKTKSRQQGEDE